MCVTTLFHHIMVNISVFLLTQKVSVQCILILEV